MLKPKNIFIQILVLIGLASILTMYQNCSKVAFSPSEDLPSEGLETPVVIGTSQVKVGAQNVPPLKLFFVVDNSYTMKANQVNLAQSFGKMFDTSNANSLANFDATAFLINTAQSAPAWGSADFQKISQLQLPSYILTGTQYDSVRSAQQNSGALPGDILGFSANISANKAEFFPAPVLGFKDEGGVLVPEIGIHKAANEDPVGLAQEFQERLALLDASRIPILSSGQQIFSQSLDKESGLCATARILKNYRDYIAPGEQAAFVIVSDEDESDPQGSACVQSLNQVTQQTELIKGKCEERTSTLSYVVTTPGVDKCNISFKNGYKYKYDWSQDTVKTDIKYRKISGGSYSTPKTRISYTTLVNTFKKTTTDISYYIKSCTDIISDGIKVGENCSYPKINGSVDGDWSGAKCSDGALKLNVAAIISNGTYPVNCTAKVVSVSSCAANDASCATVPTYPPKQSDVLGNFVAQLDCKTQAGKLSGAIIDGSQPLSCALTTAKTGSGLCPAAEVALGCTQVSQPSYTPTTVTVNGDYTTSQTACYNQAKVQSGFDATFTPECTKKLVPEAKSATGTLAFSQTLDQGITLGMGDCGTLKTAVLNQVKSSNSLANGNAGSSCSITGINATTSSQNLSGGDCQVQAASYCSTSSAQRRECSGQMVVGTPTQATTQVVLTKDANCTDLCSSQSQFCAPQPNVIVDPSMTLHDYLKAWKGVSTTCSIAKTSKDVSSFIDKPLVDAANICVGTDQKPQYLVQDGAPYRLNELVYDFVSGTNKVAGAYVPQTSLVDFIANSSAQLFGEQKPIVSVFVRTAADGTGSGGSLGVTYEQLANRMQGSVERITSTDYSSALANLSEIIKSRLERSFQIAEMRSFQKVSRVWHRTKGASAWTLLEATEWSTAGNSVTIAPSVSLEFDDELKFEYY